MSGSTKIFVTGHSLGAALAIHCAAELGASSHSLGLPIEGVYTYGQVLEYAWRSDEATMNAVLPSVLSRRGGFPLLSYHEGACHGHVPQLLL